MKRFFIALTGGTVLLVGLAMLVLPGPGVPIIASGLAILATEFLWARRTMRRAKGAAAKVRRKSGLRDWLRRWPKTELLSFWRSRRQSGFWSIRGGRKAAERS